MYTREGANEESEAQEEIESKPKKKSSSKTSGVSLDKKAGRKKKGCCS